MLAQHMKQVVTTMDSGCSETVSNSKLAAPENR